MNRKNKLSIGTVSSRLVLGTLLMGSFPLVQAADFNCSLSDNGNWTDSNNWSNCGGGIPNNNGQKYDVTLGSGKNVTVNQAIKVDAFSLSSGSLNGNSDLSVMKNTTWIGGQIGGDAGRVLAKGGLNIEGTGFKRLGRYGGSSDQGGLVNQAPGTWTGGGISNLANGRFVNDTGASFDIQTDADFSGGFFDNKGSLVKSIGATGSAEKTIISGTFTNTGTVEVKQGVLSVSGGEHTGSFTTSENGVIEFDRTGNQLSNLNNGSSVTGNVSIKNNTGGVRLNTGASFDADNTEITGKFAVTDASLTAKTKTLNLVSGLISGNGNIEVSGKTTWTGGQIGGDAGKVSVNVKVIVA